MKTGRVRVRLLLVACTVLCAWGSAESPAILLRANIRSEGDLWVGQRLLLHVDVLGRDGWAQIPSLPPFEVPGAYVVRAESQGTRLSESVAGESYTGQRYQLSLYAQRAGAITVPPVPVVVEVKSWGAHSETTRKHMTTPEVTVEVRIPPGAEGVEGLVSTTLG